jgi:hypothetical protein
MTDRRKAELAALLARTGQALEARGAGACVTVPRGVWEASCLVMRNVSNEFVADIQDTDHDKDNA